MADLSISIDALQHIPLFCKLSSNSLESLRERCQLLQAQEGELLFAEGQRGDRMYIVIDGAIKISRQIEGVGEERLSVCRQGDYFGEVSLFDDAPRSADARAIESTTLLELRKNCLEELIFADRDFACEILSVLVRHLTVRLRETNEKLRAIYQMSL